MRLNRTSPSRSQLVLMCQVIMLLIFALASAVCVRVFAFTYKSAQFNDDRDRAAIIAQNAAELCKLTQGDLYRVSEQLGGVLEDGGLEVFYDDSWQATDASAAFTLTISPMLSEPGHPEKADIRVFTADDGGELFTLTVAWQGGST